VDVIVLFRARHEIPDTLRSAKQRAVDEFMSTRRDARRLLHRVLMHPRDDVVGVGVGGKLVRNKLTGRPSIRLYVAKKLDRALLQRDHLLPAEIDGVETDVIEIGRLHAQVPAARRRQRPVRPGCSIGFRLESPHDDLLMAGTLGAVVVRGEKRFLLSNNHVLANENELPVGTVIYQPGLLDHGNPGTDAVARLAQFAPLSASAPNRVDCAIAEIIDSELTSTRLVSSKIGKLSGPQPIDAAQDMSVLKVGRGSGFTTGKVFDVSASLTLQYELGELTFADQILIRGTLAAFSEYGDSGALVIDAATRRAVGLLIGGNGEFSIANHLDDVLTELGVTLAV
jgi:hypothetical protein